jgi:chemotaxis protein MotA
VEENSEKMLDIFNSEGAGGLRTFIQGSNLPRVWGVVMTKLEIKVPIQDIQQILEFRIRKATSRLDQDIATMRLLASTAPAVGMFGSVLGLIYLLADLKDFSSLGANMSLALLTTLYGIFVGNIVFIPIVRKLETRRYVAIKNHMNLSYWLEALEARKPSFYLKSDFSKIEEKK